MKKRSSASLLAISTVSLAVIISSLPNPADAAPSRLGGGSSSGYSRSGGSNNYGYSYNKRSSNTTPNNTAGVAGNTTNNYRVGAGQAVGVQRPTNTATNMSGNGMTIPAAPGAAGGLNNPNLANANNQSRGSWVAPALAGAAAGAAIGYAVSNSGESKPVAAGNAASVPATGATGNAQLDGSVPQTNTPVASANGVAPVVPQSSGTNWFLWLLLGGLAFWVWKKGFLSPNRARAGNSMQRTGMPGGSQNGFGFGGASISGTGNRALNHADFLDRAKDVFDRLQAAHRQAQRNVLGEFATPEMVAALAPQIPNVPSTDSIEVRQQNAAVIDWLPNEQPPFASVRFTGVANLPQGAETFVEIWNFQFVQGNWYLAGIEQDTSNLA